MVLNGFHKSTLLDDFGIENKYEVDFSIRLLGEFGIEINAED